MSESGSQGLRPVEFSGHQEYWRGWFHGWHRHEDGQMFALVEVNGNVKWVEQHYCLKFLDKLPPPPLSNLGRFDREMSDPQMVGGAVVHEGGSGTITNIPAP